MRAVIVGGGIAGMCTALALHRVGFRDVIVLERARSVEPLGSGINVMPQAVRELDALAVLRRLHPLSVQTSRLIYATHTGERLWDEPRGHLAGHAWPQLSIHRGWLQVALGAEVARRLGPEAIRTGAEVRAVTEGAAGRRLVQYRDRDRDVECCLPFDLLVGADGIRSAVRRLVDPADPGPRVTGQVVWRGLVRRAPFLDGSTMVIAGDGVRKVVFYPLTDREQDGECLMNWAAAGPLEEPTAHGNWNLPADPQTFAGGFEGWSVEGVDVATMMRDSADCFVYPMVDLDPLPTWTRGPITVVGDAAHAMYPVGSNGATQSIVDSRALAFHLASEATVTDALRAYEADRRPVTTRIQRANRRRGPEIVIDIAARRTSGGIRPLSDAFAPGELDRIATGYAATTQLTGAHGASPYDIHRTRERAP